MSKNKHEAGMNKAIKTRNDIEREFLVKMSNAYVENDLKEHSRLAKRYNKWIRKGRPVVVEVQS